MKLEEINRLMDKQDYKGAMNVVDSIDWRRVKNVRTLCVVGEIYAVNKRYEDSKEVFLLAYHRAPIGKSILYRLIEVSLKMGDVDEAMEFFEEYLEVAPNDNARYILKYKIYKARNASLNEQIQILEEYKDKEFTERWSYELAKLYYKAGEKEKCLDLCNEMVLWFNDGKYVMKALELKLRMGALTGAEKEKYEKQFVPKLITPEEAKSLKDSEENAEEAPKEDASEPKEDAPVIDSIRIREDDDNGMTESMQEKIAKGIRDIFGGRKKEREDEEFLEEEDAANEDEQEEMIKGSSSEREFTDVPELEPEDAKQPAENVYKKPPAEKKEEKKVDLSQTIQMPSLKIPASMRRSAVNEVPEMPELPKTQNPFNSGSGEDGKDFEFNLEDTILAAATAQGIEIPADTSSAKTKAVEETTEEALPEEEMTEEPLAAGEEPSESIQAQQNVEAMEKPETLEQPEFLDEMPLTEDMDLEEEPEEPASFENLKNFNPPMLDEEEEMTEEDLRLAEEEFLNGPSGKAKQQEKEPEQDDLGFADLSENGKKPEGLNTELFNFQEELKKALAEQEDRVEEAAPISKPVQKQKPATEEEELEQFIESIQPQDNSDPRDLIPRGKELTEEETKLFTYFVKVPGMKEQLVEALRDVQMAAADKTSRTGNVIVMGGRETGKTRLISGLVPAICKELHMEASKVAYVFADQINGKDVTKIISKLAGGFLVIEDANQLSPETAEQLNKAMEFRTDGLTVIIEDEKIGMRKFIAKYPKLARKFTSMINIPVFTNDELVNFAKIYTKENGYTIDQMGMLALYNLIGMNQKEDEPMNIGAVKDLIDSAIAKSQGGIRKLRRNISKKRTDRDGYIVLYEKDFN
ncbi:MAG: hypothetical protein Q4C91_16765 [Eubacteriales bacterium]|nr:hypothetical protein [Eubacteriales bacterium]